MSKDKDSATPHKWAEVIKAWADGKAIQYKSVNSSQWIDFRGEDDDAPDTGPWDETNCEWRIKPERWCRVALFGTGGQEWTDIVESEYQEKVQSENETFIRWLTDRIYY